MSKGTCKCCEQGFGGTERKPFSIYCHNLDLAPVNDHALSTRNSRQQIITVRFYIQSNTYSMHSVWAFCIESLSNELSLQHSLAFLQMQLQGFKQSISFQPVSANRAQSPERFGSVGAQTLNPNGYIQLKVSVQYHTPGQPEPEILTRPIQ